MTVAKKGAAAPEPAIAQVVPELAKRRDRLDALDTQISSLIQRIEENLRRVLSTRIRVDISDPKTRVEESLIFGKHNGTWHLIFEYELPDELPDEMPLLSCPREVRARMFTQGHIDKLIIGALAQLDEQITEREAALVNGGRLADALAAFGGGK